MINYQTITVEAGQSLNRIALQYYGSSSIDLLNMLVTDNSDVLRNGITSVPAAGTRMYIRTNYGRANSRVLSELTGVGINQHVSEDEPLASSGKDTVSVEIIENVPKTIVVGSILTKSVLIYCYWKESGQIFSGLLNLMHDNHTADYSFQYDSFYGEDSSLVITVLLDETLQMTLTLPVNNVAFKYKILAEL